MSQYYFNIDIRPKLLIRIIEIYYGSDKSGDSSIGFPNYNFTEKSLFGGASSDYRLMEIFKKLLSDINNNIKLYIEIFISDDVDNLLESEDVHKNYKEFIEVYQSLDFKTKFPDKLL